MITLRLNDNGKLAGRGPMGIVDNAIVLKRNEDANEDVSIEFSSWLNGATYTSYDIDAGGLTITSDAVATNTLSFQASGEGCARITLTASDGKAWAGSFAMQTDWLNGRRFDYGWRG